MLKSVQKSVKGWSRPFGAYFKHGGARLATLSSGNINGLVYTVVTTALAGRATKAVDTVGMNPPSHGHYEHGTSQPRNTPSHPTSKQLSK